MSVRLRIGVGHPQKTAQAFVDAWRHAERGHAPVMAEERLTFENLETLLQILTTDRSALQRHCAAGSQGNSSPLPKDRHILPRIDRTG